MRPMSDIDMSVQSTSRQLVAGWPGQTHDVSDRDQLCDSCAPVDLYSLFTGPRYFPGDGAEYVISAKLGTLLEVKSNAGCPLCRLVKHILETDVFSWKRLCELGDSWSDIRCVLRPIRSDYGEEMKYLETKTTNMLASRLDVRLSGMQHTSKEVLEEIYYCQPDPGIQLLSPDSVDPSRPLLNGFQATTMESSLRLLSKWLKGCHEHHQGTCQLKDLPTLCSVAERIRVIDVHDRTLVEVDPATVTYATLSYVWGDDSAVYARKVDELVTAQDASGKWSIRLPSSVPKTIQDAIYVCEVLLIPYLWVDLYCIHQSDPARKIAELNAMGHIYRRSYVTLVAASQKRGLITLPTTIKLGERQRVERIGNRSYISMNVSIYDQIGGSDWSKRSWTYQEGHLTRRIAFFGDYDISFMCGAGHWREAFHSGVYGHEINVPYVDLSSSGFHILSGQKWLGTAKWDFEDYSSMVLNYSRRKLTYESDKLTALTGCLNMIEERKSMIFLSGLPSVDFHYALLWVGENDHRREGFPSWSWAGWHAIYTFHNISPAGDISGSLEYSGDGSYQYRHQVDMEIELQGVLISMGLERSHIWNRCTQRLANIYTQNPFSTVIIESEAARFFIDIDVHTPECREELCAQLQATSVAGLEPDKYYSTPRKCLRLRDTFGTTYSQLGYYPQLLNNRPMVYLPDTLRKSTLMWLLRDGLDLIKIVEVELIEGGDGLEPFHHVFCLGIDRNNVIPGRGRRMGMFSMPRDYWDKAEPKVMAVELW